MSPNQMSEVDMEPKPPKFSCGFDLASLPLASDLAYSSWLKISELRETRAPHSSSNSVEFKEFELGKFNIVAFASSTTPEFLQNNGDLVSSDDFKLLCSKTNPRIAINHGSMSLFPSVRGRLSNLIGKILQMKRELVCCDELDDFKFLCSKTNPGFAVNRAVMSLFYSVRDQLSNLRDKIIGSEKSTPYIITGHGIGGSIGTLFTLWLLDSLDPSTTKRPLCITFGSPLVGDSSFQEAVSQCSSWNSCFLHIVHKEDNFPNVFDSKLHCPFGTYLFCSESGSACFEASASASLVLKKMEDSHGISEGGGIQEFDYGHVIECLRGKVIYKDTCKIKGGGGVDSFKIGIKAQLAAIGFQQHMQVKRIVEHEIDARKPEAVDPSRKLNDMKILLAKFEWYMKRTANEGVGYYDSYKNMHGTTDNDVVLFKTRLDNYWENIVREVTRKPQKATGRKLRRTWRYNCTVYRRMIEPLHIADYYNEKGGRNYIAEGRPEFLRTLEEMPELESDDHDSQLLVPSTPAERRQNMMSYNMTEDSCFWAHVEEAKLSCESMISGSSDHGDDKKVLEEFEKYGFEQIKNHGVSREIFLKNSTYMKWWDLYQKVLEGNQMGSDHVSPLIEFMRSGRYEEYKDGTYAPWED